MILFVLLSLTFEYPIRFYIKSFWLTSQPGFLMEFTQINKSVVDLKTKILYQQLCRKPCQLKQECKQELHNKESKHKLQFILQDRYQMYQ